MCMYKHVQYTTTPPEMHAPFTLFDLQATDTIYFYFNVNIQVAHSIQRFVLQQFTITMVLKAGGHKVFKKTMKNFKNAKLWILDVM